MLSIDDHDFTIHKFRHLCEAIATTYPTITMAEYMDKEHPARFVLMRHDVDRMPGNALVTARIEHELGIKATYYFRSIKSVFKPEIMEQILDMGHEVGYHYETLSEANGNPEKAIELFQSHLENFNDICKVKTICMHGNSLTRWDNRDLWKYYDFKGYGIIGEAYLSINFNAITYFSDTARTWNPKYKIKDSNGSSEGKPIINKTDDLIGLIDDEKHL